MVWSMTRLYEILETENKSTVARNTPVGVYSQGYRRGWNTDEKTQGGDKNVLSQNL